MDVVSTEKSRESLTVRKQRATRARIAAAAAQRIVADERTGGQPQWNRSPPAAEVGRATFFRYFSAKEDAVAEGMTTHWLDAITAVVGQATGGVVGGPWRWSRRFDDLGDGFEAISDSGP